MTDDRPAIVGADGRELPKRPKSAACPTCGAGKDKRLKSAGFGTPHDVCGKCGFDYPAGEEAAE